MKIIKPVPEEESCIMPTYFPGDVVLTKMGGVGIIVKAQVVVNGRTIEWNSREGLPPNIEHGWKPSYAVDSIPRFKRPEKHAWYYADEFEAVALGALHSIPFPEIHQELEENLAKATQITGKYLFRFHRGSLEKSMKTVVSFNDIEELRKILWKVYGSSDMAMEKQGYDDRTDWHTWIVTLNGNAVGFSNGKP